MTERQVTEKRQGFLGRYLEARRQSRVQGIAEKIVIGAAANKNGGGQMASDMAMGWSALRLVGAETSDGIRHRRMMGVYASPPDIRPDLDKLNASLDDSPFRYRIEEALPIETMAIMMRPVFRFFVVVPELE